jgi:hypothetical protein
MTQKENYDFRELPGEWHWKFSSSQFGSNKTVVHFVCNVNEPGGWFGEIDNYVEDGDEQWDVHIRPILDDGTETGRPQEEADTCIQFDTLADAVDAVPNIVGTYYQ